MADDKLSSKMKKCDPNEFSIHDFLNECKTQDNADARFSADQEGDEPEKYFVVGGPGVKAGSLNEELGRILGGVEGWKEKQDCNGRFHLVLGGPRGNGIPWKRISQSFKYDYGIVPHCNCFRGYVWLTQKPKLVQALRVADIADVTPESYLFFPSTAEDSELEKLRVACEGGAKKGADSGYWILKSGEAHKGEHTLIMGSFDEISEFLGMQDPASAAWAIQRYISNPLLLPGNKKFDLRFFVLVDDSMKFYVGEDAVCKTCAESFDMDDVDNKQSHLSIPGKHGLNQMPIEQFSKWLSSEHKINYAGTIVPEVHNIILQVLEGCRSKLENVDHDNFTSYQVFAFDFLIDNKHKVWFTEASAVSSMPDQLVKEAAEDIFNLAIRPIFSNSKGSGRGNFFVPLEGSKKSSKK